MMKQTDEMKTNPTRKKYEVDFEEMLETLSKKSEITAPEMNALLALAYIFFNKGPLQSYSIKSEIREAKLDKEEVLQEVVVRFFKMLPQVLATERCYRMGYCTTLAKNLVCDLYRAANGRKVSTGEAIEETIADTRSFSIELENLELTKEIVVGVTDGSFSPFYSLCFLAIHLRGYKPQSIVAKISAVGLSEFKREILTAINHTYLITLEPAYTTAEVILPNHSDDHDLAKKVSNEVKRIERALREDFQQRMYIA